MKKCTGPFLSLLSAFLLLIFSSDASASVKSGDVALADARTILETAKAVEEMVTLRQFERVFGKPSVPYNLGDNMYRNCVWHLPLASADVSLDLNVGFNYDNRAEWSMSIDFGEDANAGRRYFVALCRGLEKLTGHVSKVVRFEPMRADISVNAHYPSPGGGLLAVSSSDDDSYGRIFVTPASADADRVFMVRVLGDDAPMYEKPDEKSSVVRRLRNGYTLVSFETRAADDAKYLWHRVRDGDGETGWLRGTDASPVGIFNLENAFAR